MDFNDVSDPLHSGSPYFAIGNVIYWSYTHRNVHTYVHTNTHTHTYQSLLNSY